MHGSRVKRSDDDGKQKQDATGLTMTESKDDGKKAKITESKDVGKQRKTEGCGCKGSNGDQLGFF